MQAGLALISNQFIMLVSSGGQFHSITRIVSAAQ